MFPARVDALAPEADCLFDLHVSVAGTRAAGTHVRPGQYAMLALEGHAPHPFAIASAPGSTTFEFLVKKGSPLSDALTRLGPGHFVQISEAMGPGFPLEKAAGHSILLFATGSGISAIRSTLLAIRNDRAKFDKVTLFFGARTPSAFAYMDEHKDWERDGIDIVRTVSQPGESSWDGLQGYVQEHVGELARGGELVFLCGQTEMVKGVREELARRGIPPGNLFVNF